MTKEELQARYKSLIIPESKAPYQFEQPSQFDQQITAYNALCGDKYQLFVSEADQMINTIHFHGIGCALSTASTSLMIKAIEGLTISSAVDRINFFLTQLSENTTEEMLLPDSLKTLVELKNFDGRIDCIKLSWTALLDHLNNEKTS